MSKIRECEITFSGELPPSTDGPAGSYVVYTQKKDGAPHRYAGWVNAPDIKLAEEYACEHYGQDESCINIWIHDGGDLHETPVSDTPLAGTDTPDDSSVDAWAAFTQKRRGDIHIEQGCVHAIDAATALSSAIARFGEGATQVRVVSMNDIVSTNAGRLIWRTHDQSYRLAKGYSKSVRAKWDAVRSRADLEHYRKDDLKVSFEQE